MDSAWRLRARMVIANVVATVGRDDEKALRRALRDAYQFGPRRHWPYKCWLRERKWALLGYDKPQGKNESIFTTDHPPLFPEHL